MCTERDLSQSRQWLERAKRVIPGGAQTFSKSPLVFVQGVCPNFVTRAAGPCVWDADGNRYIDYIMGLGPVILGHAYPAVNKAAASQLSDGISFSLPHPVEVEVAETLRRLVPCAKMVRYGKNGSDATSGAVRLARAYTGREVIACCGYHGWQDWFIGTTSRNRGVPAAVRNLTVPFPYNDIDSLNAIFHAHPGAIAAVIMEPVSFAAPKDRYLQEVKDLCNQNGALLIFDEVLAGFRFALGGAHGHFGVDPDLACFGKAIANGFPLSAIVGKADVMHLFEDVFFSFTFGGDAISLAAAKATLREFEGSNVPAHLWRVGQHLQNETNRLAERAGVGGFVSCIGLPPMTTISFRDMNGKPSLALRSLFQQEAVQAGILTHGNHMLSLSHTDAVIGETLAAYEQVFGVLGDAIKNDDVERRLKGPPVQAIFRQA
jgi:glutamate-1-semialdehyde aminotransferase